MTGPITAGFFSAEIKNICKQEINPSFNQSVTNKLGGLHQVGASGQEVQFTKGERSENLGIFKEYLSNKVPADKLDTEAKELNELYTEVSGSFVNIAGNANEYLTSIAEFNEKLNGYG